MISVAGCCMASRRPTRMRASVVASTEGRGVVEDEDARVDGERARDRDPLALAAGERDPALADDGLVPVGQPLDELVRLRELARPLDLVGGQLAAPKAMFSRTSRRTGTDPARYADPARSDASVTSRMSTPSIVTRPAVAS